MSETISGAIQAEAAGIPWIRVIAIVVIAAFIGYYVTKAIEKSARKRYPKSRVASDVGPDPLWWLPLLSLLSIALGGGIGYGFSYETWNATYGILIGAGTGANPPWIIKLVKWRTRKAAGVEVDETAG